MNQLFVIMKTTTDDFDSSCPSTCIGVGVLDRRPEPLTPHDSLQRPFGQTAPEKKGHIMATEDSHFTDSIPSVSISSHLISLISISIMAVCVRTAGAFITLWTSSLG